MRATRIRSALICLLLFQFIFIDISIVFSQQNIFKDRISSDSIVLLRGDSVLAIQDLNKVAAVGYGTRKIREIVTSVSHIGTDHFNQGNINNPLQLIQGKIAGLSINKSGGDPNGSYYLRMRGMNTITGVDGPLIVIDGVPEASPGNVDPADIESFDILRDAAASAIYGVRGSGGVILITTKKGKPGKSQIEYNFYSSAEMVAKNKSVMSSKEWRAASSKLGVGTDYGFSTDWFKEIEQTALSQVHNISMSGGSEKTSFRASITYRQGNGVLIKTGYNQLNGRINVSQKALNDKLKLDMNLGATERKSQYGFVEAFRYAAIYNPTAPVKSSDQEFEKYDGYFQKTTWDYYNPLAIMDLDKNEGKDRIFNMSLKATYEIMEGLSIDGFYSVQNIGKLGGIYFDKNDLWAGESAYEYFVPNMSWGGYARQGIASRKQDNAASRLFESTIHYNKDLTSVINLNLLGGYSYQDFFNEGFYAEGGNFLTDDFTFNNLSAAKEFQDGKGFSTSYKNSNKLSALFGRINLNINNLCFISASARYEGSSRFGSAHKYGLFPALGAGIDLSKVINLKSVDNLKLRLDYGVSGNVPSESYESLELYSPAGKTYYNGQFIPIYSTAILANPGLKYEQKSEVDAGLDFSLFKSRLSGTFDLFAQTASDLIYRFQNPVIQGYSYPSLWLNAGKIKSHGMELTLNYNVVNKSDCSYNISLSYSHISRNTLVSLSGVYNGEIIKYDTQNIGILEFGNFNIIKVEEGRPVGQILANAIKEISADGQVIYVDRNNDGYIGSDDRQVVGNGIPTSLLGINNTIIFKNWDLNFFFRGVFGHDLVNSYRANYEIPMLIATYNYNLPKTTNLNINTNKYFQGGDILSNLYVENASFISLDNMSLGYSFKFSENSHINKIRLYLAGNNLFYITKYKGSDPNPRYVESSVNFYYYNSTLIPGIDRLSTWSRTRSFTIGANVVF